MGEIRELLAEEGPPLGGMLAGGVIRLPIAAQATASASCVGEGCLDARDPWSGARLGAVEALWGEGFAAPGGAPEAVRLARPLGLSQGMTLLLLGGGLGGAARAISRTFGCRVVNLEARAQLRVHAVCRRGAEDGVVTGKWDREAPCFPPGQADRVLSLEALRGTAPAPLLKGLADALRPGGQLMMTELVAGEMPGRGDREFAAWCRLDDRLPELPSSEGVASSLRQLGFEIRQQEDLTDRHIAHTLEGWRQAVRAMAGGPRPTHHGSAAFVAEAELWLLRIRLMRRLGVRLMRWHAAAAY